MPRNLFTLVLAHSKEIAPGIMHLAFQREDNQPFSFIAGQFINFHIKTDDEKNHMRSFSLVNKPGGEFLEIAISYINNGLASDLLFNLKPGEKLECSGPYGRLVLKDDDTNKRYIFVGTGTGITPYRSMLGPLDTYMTSRPSLNVSLIQGVRKKNELIYGDDFLAFAHAHPNFDYHACISREDMTADGTYIHHGRVHTVLDNMPLYPETDIIYLCGNPNMIDEAFDFLTGKGFTSKNVRREKYVFSKT